MKNPIDSAKADSIVSDGEGRFREASAARVSVHRLEITREVLANHVEEYRRSGFWRRLLLRYRIQKEVSQRLRKEFPGKGALYLNHVAKIA